MYHSHLGFIRVGKTYLLLDDVVIADHGSGKGTHQTAIIQVRPFENTQSTCRQEGEISAYL